MPHGILFASTILNTESQNKELTVAIATVAAGMAWVDSFLEQAKTADAAKQKIKWPSEPPANATAQQWKSYHEEFRRLIDESRQNFKTQISSGNIKSAADYLTPEIEHNIPETIEGVDTGFLNARYITLDYLSRAEDLVENHPEIAAKVFDQGDSMHRMVLTMIKNHDFESGMEKYADAMDRQYGQEGDKLRISGMMSGLGNPYGLFGTSPEVTQFLQGNHYVNTMEKSVENVMAQQDKIAQAKASHNHAMQMANNAAYRESSSADTDPELAAQFANAWQNEEARLRGRVSGAEADMKKLLQGLKNLESRGIAGDVTEDIFNNLYAARTGDTVKLEDLYQQYGIEAAEPYIDRGATSGFARLMQQIEQNSASYMQPSVSPEHYDFSSMSRQEIANAGKQLFSEGKITLDELFRFEHPDGKLRIDTSGNPLELNPDEQIDFIAATRKAIKDMEEKGDAMRPDSSYQMMLALLNKITTLQG